MIPAVVRCSVFRLRTLIIALAIVAVILWGMHRRERFLGIAAFHDGQEAWARQLAAEERRSDAIAMTVEGYCVRIPSPGAEARETEFLGIAAYHAELVQKYRKAAAHPWASVAADPPEPKKLPPMRPPSPPSTIYGDGPP